MRDKAIGDVLKREGPYTNHPADKGLVTVWGISRKFCPDWPGWVEFDRLATVSHPNQLARWVEESAKLKTLAIEWYAAKYWAPLNCDYLPGGLACVVFDAGVNCGVSAATKWLQRSLNLLNNRGKLWPDVVVDGRMGAGTMGALDKARGPIETSVLIMAFCIARGCRYFEIGESDPIQEANELGWIRRLRDVLLEGVKQ